MINEGNGKPSKEDLTVGEKLDLLLEGLADLTNQFEEFKDEMNERLSNMNLPHGVGFELDEFDS